MNKLSRLKTVLLLLRHLVGHLSHRSCLTRLSMRLLIPECEWHGTHPTRFNTQWLQTSTKMRIEVRISLNNLPMSWFRARYHWLSYISITILTATRSNLPNFNGGPRCFLLARHLGRHLGGFGEVHGIHLSELVWDHLSRILQAVGQVQELLSSIGKSLNKNKKRQNWSFFMRLPERSHENGVYIIYMYI